MRKNTRRRNPGGKDAKDPEDQDPIDTGQRNYARWQETPMKKLTRLETRLRKMTTRDMGKLRNYLVLKLAHNFLLGFMLVLVYG